MSEPYDTKYFYLRFDLSPDFKPVLMRVQNNPGAVKECIDNPDIKVVYWGMPELGLLDWTVVAQRCKCGYVVENIQRTMRHCKECKKLKPLPTHICPAVSLERYCDCAVDLDLWHCTHCGGTAPGGGRGLKHLCPRCWQAGVR